MKVKKYYRLVLTQFVILGFLVFAVLMSGYLLGKVNTVGTLGNGWQMKAGAGTEHEVQLPKHGVKFPAYKSTTLSLVLPEDFEEMQTICIETSLKKVNVFLDGKILYQEYEGKPFEMGETAVNIRRLINIPPGSGQKELKILYYHPSESYSGIVGAVTYGARQDLMGYILYTTMPHTAMAVFSLIIGLELVIVFLFWGLKKENKSLLYLGIFMLIFGIWEFNQESGIFMTWNDSLFINYRFCVITFILLPIPFFLHIYEELEMCRRKKYRLLLYALIINAALGCVGTITYPRWKWFLNVAEKIEVLLIAAMVTYMVYCSIQTVLRFYREGRSIRYILFESRLAGVFALYSGILLGTLCYLIRRLEWTGVAVCIGSFLYACEFFHRKILQILSEANKVREARNNWEKSRNELLMSQIKPHFIYNTLTSIRVLIKKSPEQAYELTHNFSSYLKFNFAMIKNGDYITFQEELRNIKTYLSIEQVRFANRFQVCYEINADDFEVPSLTIQPLVENAVKHGEFEVGGNGTIWIRSFRRRNYYIIQIEDNGKGFRLSDEDNPRKNQSIGLKNIRDRLSYLPDSEMSIITSPGKGTMVEIKIAIKN